MSKPPAPVETVETESECSCDADGERVLPNGIFVEGREVAQNKFKSSVAAALHRRRQKVPNWNRLTKAFVARPPQARAFAVDRDRSAGLHAGLFEHDLVGKPVPTFPDHACQGRTRWLAMLT